MKTALDSSVILDVLTGDEVWADASGLILKEAQALGPLVVGECVLAEIAPAFSGQKLDDFLREWQIVFLPSTLGSAKLAGEMFRKYLERGGKAKRVLPDFLIGAHALNHTGRLLARDRGYYRDYFAELTVREPNLPSLSNKKSR